MPTASPVGALKGFPKTGASKSSPKTISSAALTARPSVLIVLPTRELAQQVHGRLLGLTAGMAGDLLHAQDRSSERSSAYGSFCAYDKMEFGQLQKLQLSHANILVSTPGRCQWLVRERFVSLEKLRVLVVDEADAMQDRKNCVVGVRELMERGGLRRVGDGTHQSQVQGVVLASTSLPAKVRTQVLDRYFGQAEDVVVLEEGWAGRDKQAGAKGDRWSSSSGTLDDCQVEHGLEDSRTSDMRVSHQVYEVGEEYSGRTQAISALLDRFLGSVVRGGMDEEEDHILEVEDAFPDEQHNLEDVDSTSTFAGKNSTPATSTQRQCVLVAQDSEEADLFCTHPNLKDQWHAKALHSRLPHAKRETVLQEFRLGKILLLIVTDSSARGLDFGNHVGLVLSAHPPADAGTYAFRASLCARSGFGAAARKMLGKSIVLHSREEKVKFEQVRREWVAQGTSGGRNPSSSSRNIVRMALPSRSELHKTALDRLLADVLAVRPSAYEELLPVCEEWFSTSENVSAVDIATGGGQRPEDSDGFRMLCGVFAQLDPRIQSEACNEEEFLSTLSADSDAVGSSSSFRELGGSATSSLLGNMSGYTTLQVHDPKFVTLRTEERLQQWLLCFTDTERRTFVKRLNKKAAEVASRGRRGMAGKRGANFSSSGVSGKAVDHVAGKSKLRATTEEAKKLYLQTHLGMVMRSGGGWVFDLESKLATSLLNKQGDLCVTRVTVLPRVRPGVLKRRRLPWAKLKKLTDAGLARARAVRRRKKHVVLGRAEGSGDEREGGGSGKRDAGVVGGRELRERRRGG